MWSASPVELIPREVRFTYLTEISWYIVGLVFLLLDYKRKVNSLMQGRGMHSILKCKLYDGNATDE